MDKKLTARQNTILWNKISKAQRCFNNEDLKEYICFDFNNISNKEATKWISKHNAVIRSFYKPLKNNEDITHPDCDKMEWDEIIQLERNMFKMEREWLLNIINEGLIKRRI